MGWERIKEGRERMIEGQLKQRIDEALANPELALPKKQSWESWFEGLKSGDKEAIYTNKLIQVGYVLKLLDEAKQDLFNTEDELTEEWFAERDAEFKSKIMDKIIKYFGSVCVDKKDEKK